jgi:polysaccharide deacetylase 2 family uncharacterized protein YibQ
MNIISRKLSKKLLISLSITLLLIMLLLLFIALTVEKKSNGLSAELNGQRIRISIYEEKIISREPIYNYKKQNFNQVEHNFIEQPKQAEYEQNTTSAHNDTHNQTDESAKNLNNENHSEPEMPSSTTTAPHEEEPVEKSATQNKDKRPAIAIVVGSLGLSRSTTDRAFKLVSGITLGFSPYSYNIEELSAQAANIGHEVLINLPLEPLDYPADDPGPHALISDVSEEENQKRLKFILEQAKESIGVYSVDSEKFTRSLNNARSVLSTLRKRNKLFVYGESGRNAALSQVAERVGYPLLANDLIIDKIISAPAINASLYKLEELAKQNGYAIGYANPYPITVDIIDEWTKSLDNKDIQLVPISSIYHLMLDENFNKD